MLMKMFASRNYFHGPIVMYMAEIIMDLAFVLISLGIFFWGGGVGLI